MIVKTSDSALLIDEESFHVSTEVAKLLNENEWDTEWEPFKVSEFKHADYRFLINLYGKCGVKWLSRRHFQNTGDDWTKRGRVVLGQLAKDVYVFYITFHKKYYKFKKGSCYRHGNCFPCGKNDIGKLG